MVNNTASFIDKSYFKTLSQRDPEEICLKGECEYDALGKSYKIMAWGDEYVIYPDEFRITCLNRTKTFFHDYLYLFIIYYLLNFKKAEIQEEWIAEKDIPGGYAFFRGPHEIPTHFISEFYQNDIQSFKEKCSKLGGTEIKLADAAYRFQIVPQIWVAVLYWEGDEDFTPEAKVLYDRNIIDQLALDIIYALAVAVCSRIGRQL